jgi:hypothetical protein
VFFAGLGQELTDARTAEGTTVEAAKHADQREELDDEEEKEEEEDYTTPK